VTCISTKIEDGGHFIPFNQNKRVLYIDLKVLSKEKIKIYIAIAKSTKTMSWQYIFWAMAIYIFIKTCCWCLFHAYRPWDSCSKLGVSLTLG
jgi:hypothetical protein